MRSLLIHWTTRIVCSIVVVLMHTRAIYTDSPLESVSTPRFQNIILTKLLNNKTYSKDERPSHPDDEPIVVRVGFYIETLASIRELDMEFTVAMYLRQQWRDARLRFNLTEEEFMVDTSLISLVWLPSLYFVNGKQEWSHDLPTPSKLMRISPDGAIFYSQKISVRLECEMYLSKFPFDSQECGIKMMSYTYNTKDIVIDWIRGDNSIGFKPNMELPEFVIDGISQANCTERYVMGIFSCVEGRIHMTRRYLHHTIQIFIPSILIVVLSWANFWIDHRAIPARVSLALLCILTITTQDSGVDNTLPRVAYLKAIDIWMSTCLLFVFGAFIEFTCVNINARKLETQIRNGVMEGAKLTAAVAANVVGLSVPKNSKNDVKTVDSSEIYMYTGDSNSLPRKETVSEEKLVTALDRKSRILFPVAFIIFNAIYWLCYLT